MFKITIDDGYVKYAYVLNISSAYSINEIWNKVRGVLNAPNCEGVMVQSHIKEVCAKAVEEAMLEK